MVGPAPETILSSVGGECGCEGGYGQVPVDKLPIAGGMVISPDFQLVLDGMLNNALMRIKAEPDISTAALAKDVAATPVRWVGGSIDIKREPMLVASSLPTEEAAACLAVCARSMQTGQCAIYKLGPRKV